MGHSLPAVFFPLHEALPDEIAGGHGDGEGQFGKYEARSGPGFRCGSSCDGKSAVSVFFQPFDGLFNPFQGIIVMAVVFFGRGHGQDVDAEAQEISDC